MTTTNTTGIPTADAQLALAAACGARPRRGEFIFTLPGVIYDAWSHAVGANSFPSPANTEAKRDAFEAVSIAYGISVDVIVRWSEAWAETLVVS